MIALPCSLNALNQLDKENTLFLGALKLTLALCIAVLEGTSSIRTVYTARLGSCAARGRAAVNRRMYTHGVR